MDVKEAKAAMVDAMNAEIEALRSFQRERTGLQSWERLQQARQHTQVMKDQFVRVSAQNNEPTEESLD